MDFALNKLGPFAKCKIRCDLHIMMIFKGVNKIKNFKTENIIYDNS